MVTTGWNDRVARNHFFNPQAIHSGYILFVRRRRIVRVIFLLFFFFLFFSFFLSRRARGFASPVERQRVDSRDSFQRFFISTSRA